jgi:hypothetical protein
MPSYDQVREHADQISDRLSAQSRTLGLGLLAFTWGVLVSDAEVARQLAQARKWQLLLISLLAITGLLLDFLHYVAAYRVTKSLIDKMDSTNGSAGSYDYKSIAYKLQFLCFYGKQVVLAGSAVWLLITVIWFLVGIV